jgi:hypothetical protein
VPFPAYVRDVREGKAIITEHVPSVPQEDILSRGVPFPAYVRDVREGKAIITEHVQSVPQEDILSRGVPFPAYVRDVREGKAIITEHVQSVPQEATLARSSEMEPLPERVYCPSYLEEMNLHFFYYFESTLLSYTFAHVFLLIIALLSQRRFYVFINLYRSLYAIISFSLSFIAQIFLCTLGNYINLFYMIWFEYSMFTFTGNLKFQKTYLFLPQLGKSTIFITNSNIIIYISLGNDW